MSISRSKGLISYRPIYFLLICGPVRHESDRATGQPCRLDNLFLITPILTLKRMTFFQATLDVKPSAKQQTNSVHIINTHHVVMFKDTVGTYCENRTKIINMLCGKRQNFLTSRLVVFKFVLVVFKFVCRLRLIALDSTVGNCC